MTTSTTSTTDTLDLTRDTLSLVVVSPDYFATGDQHHLMPKRDDESRTYYATASRRMGEDWAVILVDWDTDPRGQVGWRAGSEYSDLVNPDTHGGWNIRRQYLTPVTTTTAEDAPTSATTAPETTEETAPEVFTREDVDRLVQEAREAARREADRRFEEWKERASEIACQYADDNGLCGEFERCMDELGLKGRERDYVVVFTVTVEARNEDHARERAVEDIYDRGHSGLYDILSDIEEV